MGFSDFSVKKLEISLSDSTKTPEERQAIQLQIESLKKDQELYKIQGLLNGSDSAKESKPQLGDKKNSVFQ